MSICESKFFNVNVSANDAKRTAGGRVQAGHLLVACLSHLTDTYKPHSSPESVEKFGRHFSCTVFWRGHFGSKIGPINKLLPIQVHFVVLGRGLPADRRAVMAKANGARELAVDILGS